jgi:hypothetical protein
MSGVAVHVVPPSSARANMSSARANAAPRLAPLRAWRRSAPGAATRYQHRVGTDG